MTRTLVVLALLAGSFVACTINKRSDEFTCNVQADCPTDRTCTDGVCVQGNNPNDGSNPDMNTGPDAFVCPAQCTSCRQAEHICKVDCGISPSTCNSPINCPPGFSCEIVCSTTSGCQNINCTGGNGCTIGCTGTGTCKNVTCGTGPCDITCSGVNACRSVDCNNSCQCDVACAIGTSCMTLNCPKDATTCNTIGKPGCDSSRATCDTCP